MTRFFLFIIVLMSLLFPNSIFGSEKEDSKDIDLTITNESNSLSHHRAPMRINISAFYNAINNTVEITYEGECEGEVYLFLDETIIGYDSEINTSIQLPISSGTYKIEIISENWTASGSFKL